jgi:hypothetical protein
LWNYEYHPTGDLGFGRAWDTWRRRDGKNEDKNFCKMIDPLFLWHLLVMGKEADMLLHVEPQHLTEENQMAAVANAARRKEAFR